MSQAFRLLKNLLHLLTRLLGQLPVGPASQLSEDHLDHHTISISTR